MVSRTSIKLPQRLCNVLSILVRSRLRTFALCSQLWSGARIFRSDRWEALNRNEVQREEPNLRAFHGRRGRRTVLRRRVWCSRCRQRVGCVRLTLQDHHTGSVTGVASPPVNEASAGPWEPVIRVVALRHLGVSNMAETVSSEVAGDRQHRCGADRRSSYPAMCRICDTLSS